MPVRLVSGTALKELPLAKGRLKRNPVFVPEAFPTEKSG
jgi:hypothetical protein